LEAIMRPFICLLILSAPLVGDDKPLSAFRTEPVKRGDLTATVTATGSLQPEETVDVGAQVTGAILRFGTDPKDHYKTIDWGTAVDEGTVLAQVDPALYKVAVEQAQAAVHKAQAVLRLGEIRANLAEPERQRAQKLQTAKAISQVDFEAVRSRVEVAKAEIVVHQAEVQQAQAALKLAETNLGFCTIKSPITGVVIDRPVSLGQTLIVTAGCGLAQRWGGPIEEIRPGDVIWFPPGEKH
jgi:HlyD family secretion protein